ncbi:polysaccharide pyruvyl transferase family protein [Modestobacter sp. VKM Ac-2977]|uniref:polysaccharide pyruvyl transferase family protein n=1 Tax=Modestobacter sp. VKM Ac-2977 TaxID=3004131 RepID=UPI0022AAAF8C|nr:polysaccharide pyruvyl transferase family protein [Modestobacter sp. VKM Ac-2977]MCZ2822754.1 polysaccharide pyruvyl transferase family protein [Modestobacter sp. VKM Ac-2977]
MDPVVLPGSRVALLDFPLHSNVGDSAIWLGSAAYLRGREAEVVHRATWRTYHPETLRSRLGPDGIVLLNGGGNFGDLYRRHQQLRERVLADLPDHRVVQLPQTVNFSSPAALDAFATSHGRHEQLVVLVRDHQSRDLLSGRLANEPVLSPDMVFALGPLPRPAAPTQDVLALLRSDHETAGPRAEADALGVDHADWIGSRWDGDVSLVDRGIDLVGRGQRVLPDVLGGSVDGVIGQAMQRRAVREVARGCRMLTAGRVVVTDRLHAHLLSHLMGIPQVLLADRHGKVTRASTLWVGDHPHIRQAGSVAEALTEVAPLLRVGGGPGAAG